MIQKSIQLKKGEYLFMAGDTADSLFYVKSGSLRVSKTIAKKEKFRKGRVVAGEIVGELSLFDKKNRLYNLKAMQNCVIDVIPYRDLLNKKNKLPVWVSALIKSLILHFQKFYPLVAFEIESEIAL